MTLFEVKQVICCAMFALAAYSRANNLDSQTKFAPEESWENQEILSMNGDLQIEDESISVLTALLEQPIKETDRLKRDAKTSRETSSGGGPPNTICREKLDLGFILDKSGSIGTSNFDKIKSFVKDLTDHFDVSQEYTRVSVMSYSTSSTIHFLFSRQFLSRNELHYAIDSISYDGGGTYTGEALMKAYTTMFNATNGARFSDARQVLIVLTDGQSSDGVARPAQQLKNAGVITYSIGVGSGVDVTQLETMASLPADEHVYLLGNFTELSTLAGKLSKTTCKATSYLVLCTKDYITVIIARDMLSSADIDNMYLADGVCKASYNATHAYVTTGLNKCGTVYSETDQEMYYNNTLTAVVPTLPGSVITREQSRAFTFKCTYNRLISVSGLKFVPPKPILKVEKSDIGKFSVHMNSFTDAGFISSSSESYPVFKSFEERLYIQYGVNTNNTDIVIRAETCRATPSSRPYDTPQYELISQGCDEDPTINHQTNGLQQYHQFSIQVFRFVADHPYVYIHCDLRLCNRNIPGSFCTKSTTCSRRKRRDEPELDTSEQTFQVSIGPIVYRKKAKEENKKTDPPQVKVVRESSPNTVMIVILICVALIVVLLAVTGLFLVRRRISHRSTTSIETTARECPKDKVMSFDNESMAKK